MPVIENKSTFCVDCLYVFDHYKKYHSRDRCNACYQKMYVKDSGKGYIKKEKIDKTNCVKCNGEFDTLNEKSRPIKRASNGLCRSCYTRGRKPTKICKKCGNVMMVGSLTGLCAVCKLNKEPLPGRRVKKKKINIPEVDKEQFELIRRLLVRFKVGHNTMVDTFRVIDIYMDVNNNPILLDTLSEEAQLVEMLKNLKMVFHYNLDKMTFKPIPQKVKGENATAHMKEYRKNWYKKNKEKVLERQRNEYYNKKEKVSIK
jgi:hypothetical protein